MPLTPAYDIDKKHPPSYECNTATPWGRADFGHKYASGIISYSTPGHGGFHLSSRLNAQVHPAWRDPDGWYEEDCEWAVVAITFPEVFHPDHQKIAHECALRWYEDKYRQVFPESPPCAVHAVAGQPQGTLFA